MHNKIETELETNIRYIESRFEAVPMPSCAEFWWVMKSWECMLFIWIPCDDRDFIDGVVLKVSFLIGYSCQIKMPGRLFLINIWRQQM